MTARPTILNRRELESSTSWGVTTRNGQTVVQRHSILALDELDREWSGRNRNYSIESETRHSVGRTASWRGDITQLDHVEQGVAALEYPECRVSYSALCSAGEPGRTTYPGKTVRAVDVTTPTLSEVS